MTLHYAGKHRAAKTASPARRTTAGVAAAAAVGVGGPLMAVATASPAMANAQGPTSSTETTTTDSVESTSGDSGQSTSGDLVQRGSTGDDVRAVQEQLDVSVDGVFGPETEAAVEDFQDENGLAVDGIVGPETWAALGGSSDEGSNAGSSDSADSAETTSTDSDDSSASSSGVLETAESLVGTPYEYGGEDPSGFDCSGFTQYVFGQHGIDLPRTTGAQQDMATQVSDPQPGDLVFFGDEAYHVGIYAGDGQIYDSGTEGSHVQKRDIWTDDVTFGRV